MKMRTSYQNNQLLRRGTQNDKEIIANIDLQPDLSMATALGAGTEFLRNYLKEEEIRKKNRQNTRNEELQETKSPEIELQEEKPHEIESKEEKPQERETQIINSVDVAFLKEFSAKSEDIVFLYQYIYNEVRKIYLEFQ